MAPVLAIASMVARAFRASVLWPRWRDSSNPSSPGRIRSL